MRKRLLLGFVLSATVCALSLKAQVSRSAVGPGAHLWAGGEYSNFNPDWGIPRLNGVTAFADFEVYGRFGLEGEARFLNFAKQGNVMEKSFLLGPYMRVFRHQHFSGAVKLLGGAVFVHYPPSPDTYGEASGSYLAYAPGGEVEYRLAPRLKLRGGYEYQLLPSAPGLPLTPNHGLTPNGFSAGASYRIF